jgi:hypothetical protein
VHMQLLDRAKSSQTENRPAFSVRVVQVRCEHQNQILFLNQLLTLHQQSNCGMFLSQLCLLQVPPEVDATETHSAEPNSIEEGASATPRKLAYVCFLSPSYLCLSADHSRSSFKFQC